MIQYVVHTAYLCGLYTFRQKVREHTLHTQRFGICNCRDYLALVDTNDVEIARLLSYRALGGQGGQLPTQV